MFSLFTTTPPHRLRSLLQISFGCRARRSLVPETPQLPTAPPIARRLNNIHLRFGLSLSTMSMFARVLGLRKPYEQHVGKTLVIPDGGCRFDWNSTMASGTRGLQKDYPWRVLVCPESELLGL